MIDAAAAGPTGATGYRRFLGGLAILGTGGTMAELAFERHWDQPIKLVPWFAAALVMAATCLVAVRRDRASVLFARAIAVGVIAASAFGVWEHVRENYHAGPLDARYATTWDTLSETGRWWKAATKAVGTASILAAGALVQAALCLVAYTWQPSTAPDRSSLPGPGADPVPGRSGPGPAHGSERALD